MIVLSRNDLLLRGRDNEEITVEIAQQDTTFLVSFELVDKQGNSLDGGKVDEGDSIKFTLNKSQIEVTLTLRLEFEPAGQGSYTVTVKGSKGGSFPMTFEVGFGVDTIFKPYIFKVAQN